jgi:drug/metabolite transporter (DMT)-like permease
MLFPYIRVLLLESKDLKSHTTLRLVDMKHFLLYVVLLVIGDLGYNASLNLGGSVVVVGTVAGSYAALSTFLAYKLYQEPLNKKQKIGILITITGIILTAYFSSIA